MSLHLLTLVWQRSPHKDGALLLLLALADWADDDGFSFPSVAGLARKARMGERHARRLLREFEEEGTIATEQHGVHHRPNSYRISVEKLLALPDRLKCPPSDSDRTPMSAQTGHGCPSGGAWIAPDPSGTVIEPSDRAFALTAADEPDTKQAKAEAIYTAYPKKVARGSALKAIGKALGKIDAVKLLELTLSYAAAVGKWPEDDKRFIPHPATWFNRESYLDDPKNWTRTYDAPTKRANPRDCESTRQALTEYEAFDRLASAKT